MHAVKNEKNPRWSLTFDKIYYSNSELFQIQRNCILSIENNFIISTFQYFNLVRDIFGKKCKNYQVDYSFQYLSCDKDIDKEVLLRFSKKLGYVDADDLSGEPVYVSITDKHTVTLPTEKEAAKRKLTGLVYNVPSMADVQVFSGSGNYFSGEMPFAQYGTVDVLGPTLFGKDVTTKVVFDTATGGVKVIE
jgi:hypothetical protein